MNIRFNLLSLGANYTSLTNSIFSVICNFPINILGVKFVANFGFEGIEGVQDVRECSNLSPLTQKPITNHFFTRRYQKKPDALPSSCIITSEQLKKNIGNFFSDKISRFSKFQRASSAYFRQTSETSNDSLVDNPNKRTKKLLGDLHRDKQNNFENQFYRWGKGESGFNSAPPAPSCKVVSQTGILVSHQNWIKSSNKVYCRDTRAESPFYCLLHINQLESN